jgi:hypothetical protein
LRLLLLPALGGEQAVKEVETERMASATAPKYARGGSVLRRGIRDGVLSSTSAIAAYSVSRMSSIAGLVGVAIVGVR